jgi:hypothetical protein
MQKVVAGRGIDSTLSSLEFSFRVGMGFDPSTQSGVVAFPRHEPRNTLPKVHPIDPEVLHPKSGVEVLRVSPGSRPTLQSVIDQLELHPPAGAPTTFHWAIADTANSSDQALDHLSTTLMGSEFGDLTVKRDQGKLCHEAHRPMVVGPP